MIRVPFTKMNFLHYIIIVLAVFAIAPVVYLTYLNPSAKLLSPILSIILGGSITILITAISSLKDSKTEKKIVTSIFFDMKENLPALATIKPESIDIRRNRIHMDLYKLGRPYKIVNQKGNSGELALTITPPLNKIEKISYGCELLQHAIVKSMDRLYLTNFVYQIPNKLPKVVIFSPPAYPTTKVPVQYFSDILKNTRLFDSSSLLIESKLEVFWPTEIDIKIKTTPSKSGIHDCYQVIFSRNQFFTAIIDIDWLTKAEAKHQPPGLTGIKDIKPSRELEVFYFTLTMKATFHWITSANPETELCQKWVEWLFNTIEQDFADTN